MATRMDTDVQLEIELNEIGSDIHRFDLFAQVNQYQFLSSKIQDRFKLDGWDPYPTALLMV